MLTEQSSPDLQIRQQLPRSLWICCFLAIINAVVIVSVKVSHWALPYTKTIYGDVLQRMSGLVGSPLTHEQSCKRFSGQKPGVCAGAGCCTRQGKSAEISCFCLQRIYTVVSSNQQKLSWQRRLCLLHSWSRFFILRYLDCVLFCVCLLLETSPTHACSHNPPGISCCVLTWTHSDIIWSSDLGAGRRKAGESLQPLRKISRVQSTSESSS